MFMMRLSASRKGDHRMLCQPARRSTFLQSPREEASAWGRPGWARFAVTIWSPADRPGLRGRIQGSRTKSSSRCAWPACLFNSFFSLPGPGRTGGKDGVGAQDRPPPNRPVWSQSPWARFGRASETAVPGRSDAAKCDATHLGARARNGQRRLRRRTACLLALPANPFFDAAQFPASAASRHQSGDVSAPVLRLGARPPRRARGRPPQATASSAQWTIDTILSTEPAASEPQRSTPPVGHNRAHGRAPRGRSRLRRTLTTAEDIGGRDGHCPGPTSSPQPPARSQPQLTSRPTPQRDRPPHLPLESAARHRSQRPMAGLPPPTQDKVGRARIIRCRMVQVEGLLAHPGQRHQRPPGRLPPPDDGGPGPAAIATNWVALGQALGVK